jgi:crotonobetainyl-CoA:carnitine CoA-transferase CaiB-like acyl-CoA transferase
MVAVTKDGRGLQFSNFRPHLVATFVKSIGLEEWHAEAVARGDSQESIREAVLRRLHEKTLDEWMEIFLQYDDVGVEPFRTPAEAMDHPQMLHNGHVIDVVDPVLGKTRQIGPLVDLARTPAQPAAGAPALGEHTETASFPPRPATPATSGALPAAPLAGVTVVELAWFYAAPFGTALLADLGARVIKAEGPDGDPHRWQSPLREFAGVKGLQGKESLAVDYRMPEGRVILHKLVARADMVMRNYREHNSAGSAIDYATLSAVNPDLVYLYAAAYGHDGPYGRRPAFAPTIGAAAGYRGHQLGWASAITRIAPISFEQGMAMLDELSQWPPGGTTNNADAGAAMAVGTAMMLGLIARQRAGVGQYLESTMLCSNAYAVSQGFFDYEGADRGAPHTQDGVHALYRLYPTAAGWVFLAAPSPADWARLRDALGPLGLASDGRYSTAEGRTEHDADLAAAIAAVLAGRAAAEWEALLVPQGIACVEVSQTTLSDFTISSETVVANRFVEQVTHPVFGPHLRHGPVATLSATPGVVGPASLVGQHTRQILAELGYSDTEMEELRAKGVVAWPDGSG